MPKAAHMPWPLLFLLWSSPVLAQNISGVINTYYPVIETIPAKAAVRVSNSSGLGAYNNVMLVQMKGAAIDATNSSSFGTVTQLNNAGNFELQSICGIRGDTVFFLHTLNNNYDITGKVQLVRIPEYPSATVVAPLSAAPWNNTNGTGGVLAVIATNTLILNSNISADSMGFKGGGVQLLTAVCGSFWPYPDYYYDPTAASSSGGTFKGEGITDQLPVSMSGGRGPQANGGGGGNDHNNGGGGGANLAAGGIGGNNISTSGCNNKYPGLGGVALSNTGSRIYAGGGGGSGHANNTVTAYGGGNGGGIVFIKAAVINGNGYTISAGGEKGTDNIGDGGGGGGGGGTIILDAGNYSGALTISANGGKGGDVDNQMISNRSMGPGGGGSGGAIYFTGATPAATVSAAGGLPGLSYNTSPAGLGGNGGAAPGNTGSITPNFVIPKSVTASGYCSGLVLPLNLLYFEGYRQGNNALLTWQVTDPSSIALFTVETSGADFSWKKAGEIRPAGDPGAVYTAAYPLPAQQVTWYRLRITDNGGRQVLSKWVAITSQGQTGYFAIYPNPAQAYINVSTSLKGLQQLRLFSADGKLVFNTSVSFAGGVNRLALPPLQPGFYILECGEFKKTLVVRQDR